MNAYCRFGLLHRQLDVKDRDSFWSSAKWLRGGHGKRRGHSGCKHDDCLSSCSPPDLDCSWHRRRPRLHFAHNEKKDDPPLSQHPPCPQSSSSVPCCTAAAVAVPLPSHPRLEQSDRTASSRRLRTVLFACETRRTERDFSFPSLASRTVSRLACTARHYSKLIFWCVGSSKPAGTPVQTQTISANQGWTRVLL